MADAPSPGAIAPSVLGTKDHWDTTYAAELTAYRADGTPGEEWFDDRLSADRLTTWVARLLPPPPAAVAVVDVGCGSGGFLVSLSQFLSGRSPPPTLHGVDYAADAVALAAAVAAAEVGGGGGGAAAPTFSVVDVLEPGALRAAVAGATAGFTLVHDKGTLDAFLLRADAAAAVAAYLAVLRDLTRPGDVLAVTSCNLSGQELASTVMGGGAPPAGRDAAAAAPWAVAADLPYPTLRFGGVTGAVLATTAFVRR